MRPGITGLSVEQVAVHKSSTSEEELRRTGPGDTDRSRSFRQQVPYPLQIIWTREQDIPGHGSLQPLAISNRPPAAGLGRGKAPGGSGSIAPTRKNVQTLLRRRRLGREGKLDKMAVEWAGNALCDSQATSGVLWIQATIRGQVVNWWAAARP